MHQPELIAQLLPAWQFVAQVSWLLPIAPQELDPEVHGFVKKVFEKSGIDKNGSYLPHNLHPQHTSKPRAGLDESFAEAKLVMGGAVEEVLKKTGTVCLHGLVLEQQKWSWNNCRTLTINGAAARESPSIVLVTGQ